MAKMLLALLRKTVFVCYCLVSFLVLCVLGLIALLHIALEVPAVIDAKLGPRDMSVEYIELERPFLPAVSETRLVLRKRGVALSHVDIASGDDNGPSKSNWRVVKWKKDGVLVRLQAREMNPVLCSLSLKTTAQCLVEKPQLDAQSSQAETDNAATADVAQQSETAPPVQAASPDPPEDKTALSARLEKAPQYAEDRRAIVAAAKHLGVDVSRWDLNARAQLLGVVGEKQLVVDGYNYRRVELLQVGVRKTNTVTVEHFYRFTSDAAPSREDEVLHSLLLDSDSFKVIK